MRLTDSSSSTSPTFSSPFKSESLRGLGRRVFGRGDGLSGILPSIVVVAGAAPLVLLVVLGGTVNLLDLPVMIRVNFPANDARCTFGADGPVDATVVDEDPVALVVLAVPVVVAEAGATVVVPPVLVVLFVILSSNATLRFSFASVADLGSGVMSSPLAA
jgi:hypothetical protein